MKKAFICLFILLFISLNITASADSFGFPMPSYMELEEGDKIFYMTPPRFEEDYPLTGLYYNIDPLQNIYLVSSTHQRDDVDYFDKRNVFFSNCSMYFVYLTIPWQKDRGFSSQQPEIVLQFYEKGNLIKQYTVSQLVKDESKLRYTTSMIFWLDIDAEKEEDVFNYNPQNNTLIVTTIDKITYKFDIITGEIIQSGNKHILIIIIAGVILLCALILALLIGKKKLWKKKDFKNL